jgi:hypothetical protein
MPWLSENYEKAILGGSVLTGLAFCYLGWSSLSDVDEDFSAGLAGSGSNATSVSGADLIPKTLQSLQLTREWPRGTDMENRPVDLFTGVPLFLKSDAPEKPIDLTKDAPVHPPIPNTWWLEKRLDPGFAHAPSMDPDGDGFSNLEEFHADSDPQNIHSHPPLHRKLTYVKDISMAWVLRPSFGDNGSFPFVYEDSQRRQNRVPASEPIREGDVFFKSGIQQNRFKLLGSIVRKEVNPRTNEEREVTWVKIEDQKPNKRGNTYEFPAPLSPAQVNNHLQYDRTAVFTLDAVGRSGEEFQVEENTRFALPHDAKEKQYVLKSVTPEKIVIEYKKSGLPVEVIEILKGAMPIQAP